MTITITDYKNYNNINFRIIRIIKENWHRRHMQIVGCILQYKQNAKGAVHRFILAE